MEEQRNLLREQCEASEKRRAERKAELEKVQLAYFQLCAQYGDQMYRANKIIAQLDTLNAKAKELDESL